MSTERACEECGGAMPVRARRFCSRACTRKNTVRALAGSLPQQQRKPNDYEIDGDRAWLIVRPRDADPIRVLVDAEDVPRLRAFTWRLNSLHGRIMGRPAGTRASVYLHRLLTSCPTGMVVDHINRDILDNRKANLRVCTSAENSQNQGARKGRSLPRGVTWKKHAKLFKAEHKLNYENVHIGYFKTAKEADAAARAWRAAHMPYATG